MLTYHQIEYEKGYNLTGKLSEVGTIITEIFHKNGWVLKGNTVDFSVIEKVMQIKSRFDIIIKCSL